MVCCFSVQGNLRGLMKAPSSLPLALLHPQPTPVVCSSPRPVAPQLVQYPPTIPDHATRSAADAHAQMHRHQSNRGHLGHAGYPILYPTAPPPPPDYKGRLSWELTPRMPGYDAVMSQLQAGMAAASLPAGSTSVAETRQLDLVVTPQESYTNGDLKKGAWSPLEHHAPGRLSAQESQVRSFPNVPFNWRAQEGSNLAQPGSSDHACRVFLYHCFGPRCSFLGKHHCMLASHLACENECSYFYGDCTADDSCGKVLRTQFMWWSCRWL